MMYVRLKPEEKSDLMSISRDQSEIRFQDTKSHKFNFSRIFPQNISIQEIFDTTTKPLINSLKLGSNSVILTYGHRQTGKKYCLFGNQENGIFQLAIQNLLDDYEESKATKEFTISISILDLFEEKLRDLGRGYKNPTEYEKFENEVELKETLGKVVTNAFCFDVFSLIEANRFIRECFDFRRNYEKKFGDYADRAHLFILVCLKQRNKESNWNPVTSSTLVIGGLAACQRPKMKSGKEYYEHPGVFKSFNAMAKVLANIKSPKIPWRDHILTKVLKIGLSEIPRVVIIANIDPSKNYIQDSIHALRFIEKCRPSPSSLSTEKLTEQDIDMKIQKLQEEKKDLKTKLKKIEYAQDLQLKKLCELIGVSEDTDGILNETNTYEIEKIQSRKESLAKLDSQVKKNEELQKKVDDNKVTIERIKRLEYSNQELHIKKLIDLKEHLQRLKDELVTVKVNSKYYEHQKITSKSEELSKMLENSKLLIKEKEFIVQNLPLTLKPTLNHINSEELKSQGKQEILETYTKRFAEQLKIQNDEIKLLNQKKTQILSEKQSIISNMTKNFGITRQQKKSKIKSMSQELINLYDLITHQKRVIENIQTGKYNQNLKAVSIPSDKIPELPCKEKYEEQFMIRLSKLIKTNDKNSSYSIKKLKEAELLNNEYISELYIDPNGLSEKEALKLLNTLKEINENNDQEIVSSEIKINELQRKIKEQGIFIENIKSDRDLYKEIATKEQKQASENRFYIDGRKNIESIISIPLKSPKRPYSQKISRPRK